jgi:predicted metalloprotease with PDZ domain
MKYTFSYNNAHRHFLNIRIEFKVQSNSNVIIQLPSWRPGRYELGNFAKNIKDFTIVNKTNEKLNFYKATKDSWLVDTVNNDIIVVSYLYFSNKLDAGSTFLDEQQLYINPINCCAFIPEQINDSCTVFFDIPKDYKIFTSLKEQTYREFIANDFHELVDSPIFSSNSIQHNSYESNGIIFHICFQGNIIIPWEKLITDFKKFTDYQINRYKSFPVEEYYFLFQITTYPSYHGVEHCKSTVLLLGPNYEVFNKKYDNLLGISSHELYHTWNVKHIRPEDMFPYDYTKENYTKLGYVTEGVTTYMGDRMLYESKVFSEKQYCKELETLLTRHFYNDGRKHYSVSESSFDTWLDGYVKGVAGRKVSIYVEGSLIALICDARIRKFSNNIKTLHNVMTRLYSGSNEISSYDKDLYKQYLEEESGVSFDDIFDDLIYGKADFTPYLNEALSEFDLNIDVKENKKHSYRYGFISLWTNNRCEISNVLEDSSAYNSGLVEMDKIIAINGISLNNNIDKCLEYHKDAEELLLSIERNGRLKRISLNKYNENQYYSYQVESNA